MQHSCCVLPMSYWNILTDVQLWRAKQEKQVWRKNLAEAVGVESWPDCQQSAASGGLKAEGNPFLWDAACWRNECGIWRDPGHKSGSLHPPVAFKHQEQAWRILWQKSKHNGVKPKWKNKKIKNNTFLQSTEKSLCPFLCCFCNS